MKIIALFILLLLTSWSGVDHKDDCFYISDLHMYLRLCGQKAYTYSPFAGLSPTTFQFDKVEGTYGDYRFNGQLIRSRYHCADASGENWDSTVIEFRDIFTNSMKSVEKIKIGNNVHVVNSENCFVVNPRIPDSTDVEFELFGIKGEIKLETVCNKITVEIYQNTEYPADSLKSFTLDKRGRLLFGKRRVKYRKDKDCLSSNLF